MSHRKTEGYEHIAALLLQCGADTNSLNYNEASALTFAATFNQPEIVKLLMEAGADQDLSDSRGNTAFDHALLQGNEEVIQLLKSSSHGAE